MLGFRLHFILQICFLLLATIGITSMLHYRVNVLGCEAKLTTRPTQATAKLEISCRHYKQLTLLSRH